MWHRKRIGTWRKVEREGGRVVGSETVTEVVRGREGERKRERGGNGGGEKRRESESESERESVRERERECVTR